MRRNRGNSRSKLLAGASVAALITAILAAGHSPAASQAPPSHTVRDGAARCGIRCFGKHAAHGTACGDALACVRDVSDARIAEPRSCVSTDDVSSREHDGLSVCAGLHPRGCQVERG